MANKQTLLDGQMRDLHPFSLVPQSVLMLAQQADVRLQGSSQVSTEISIRAKRALASSSPLCQHSANISGLIKENMSEVEEVRGKQNKPWHNCNLCKMSLMS